MVSFEDIISKSAFNIVKCDYGDLKLGNVLRVFFVFLFNKKTHFFAGASILLS